MNQTSKLIVRFAAIAVFGLFAAAAAPANAQSTFGPSATVPPPNVPPPNVPPPTRQTDTPPMRMMPDRMPDVRVPATPINFRDTQTVLPRRAVRNHLENRSDHGVRISAQAGASKAANSPPAAGQLLDSVQPIL